MRPVMSTDAFLKLQRSMQRETFKAYLKNCDLYAQGRIYVLGKKGSLAGGTACAEQGLRVNILGNQAGLATYIRLGVSERLHK